jgi:steroid 5-alpha reductase family enzyme
MEHDGRAGETTIMSALYWSTDPLFFALGISAALAVLCWLLSIVTHEYSWVDRLWSIAPVGYAAHFAAHAEFENARLNLIAGLVTLWGIRLTYNYARKGGYARGGEDYRWADVRERTGAVGFQLLNATFIAPFQNLLLLFITVPAYVAYLRPQAPLNLVDLVAAGAFLLFFAGEAIADEQQWCFQTEKSARRKRDETQLNDFITTGLFRYSRHPNFFCEQAMWWSVYAFSVAAGATWFNWTIAGAASLSVLFQGSTLLTERISARKYPGYAAYQAKTGRLFPRPPRP